MSVPEQQVRTGPPMDRKTAFLNEIKRLTLQASVDPDTFFRAFFERVGAILEAQGGSMWFHEKASDKLHCRVDSKPKAFASATPETDVIEKAVMNAIKSDNSILVAPDQADSALTKALGKEAGSDVLSAMCVPYEIDQESSGALFFYTDGTARRFDTTDVYLVKQLATYVRAYCLNWKCQQLQARTAKLDALTKLSADLHDSLNPEQIAFVIVNMPPDLVAHDRASLALLKADRARIAAISGQDMVQQRSALVKLLTEIGNWVSKKGEVTVVTRQSLDATEDARLKTLVERYYQDTNMEILLALPIKDGQRALGVLMFERRGGTPFTGQDLAMVQILTNQVRVALNNARKYRALPMVSTLEQIATAREKLTGKRKVKAALQWGILAFVLFVLIFVKYPFMIHVPCTVMTKESRNVTARVEGPIKEVLRNEGDTVEPGEIIAKIDDTQLKIELIGEEGTLKRLEHERNQAKGEGDTAKVKITEAQMDVSRQRVKQLQIQIKDTDLRSTIKGTILTGHLDLKKDQTVRVGDVFCQMALLDPMLLEMDIPEDDVGFVKEVRTVVAPFDVTVAEVYRSVNDKVSKGEAIAAMDDGQLKQQIQQIHAGIKLLEKEQKALARDPDRRKAIEAQIAESRGRLAPLYAMVKESVIRSPIVGTLLSLDVQKGQVKRAGEAICQVGCPVKFLINALPDRQFEGNVEKISQESKIREGQNVYVASMVIPNPNGMFSKGMRGTASIDAGREVVGYILFRKIWNFIRIRVLF